MLGWCEVRKGLLACLSAAGSALSSILSSLWCGSRARLPFYGNLPLFFFREKAGVLGVFLAALSSAATAADNDRPPAGRLKVRSDSSSHSMMVVMSWSVMMMLVMVMDAVMLVVATLAGP